MKHDVLMAKRFMLEQHVPGFPDHDLIAADQLMTAIEHYAGRASIALNGHAGMHVIRVAARIASVDDYVDAAEQFGARVFESWAAMFDFWKNIRGKNNAAESLAEIELEIELENRIGDYAWQLPRGHWILFKKD